MGFDPQAIFHFRYLLVCHVFFIHATGQGLTNMALNKPASQSTGHPTYGRPERAVDGNKGTSITVCTQTADVDANPERWWRVDLQATVEVHAVVLTNRGDCCGYRLANFDVEVARSLHDPAQSYQDNRIRSECVHQHGQIPGGATALVNCTQPVIGRYVTLILPTSSHPLHFCEMEVLAKPVVLGPSVTTFSKHATDHKAVGDILRDTYARSVTHCATTCALEVSCSAINMQPFSRASRGERRPCQLLANGGPNHPSELQAVPGWDVYIVRASTYQ